jgi:hypothetical protein
MQFQTRIRDAATRVRPDKNAVSLPSGALPLAAALLVLIAVPIARADDEPAASTGGSPVVTESASSPKLSARVVRSRSIGGRPVRISVRLRGVGSDKARVRLAVRTVGTRKWNVVASKSVRGGRSFRINWRSNTPGRYMTRVSVRKSGRVAAEHTGAVFVFRRSFASYYGPGLYGGALACGGRLSPGTIGVAHKTLPCGTKVTFTLGNGRTVTAPVIDRGPFVAGRSWDLTAGLKNKLGFGSTGPVYATR